MIIKYKYITVLILFIGLMVYNSTGMEHKNTLKIKCAVEECNNNNKKGNIVVEEKADIIKNDSVEVTSGQSECFLMNLYSEDYEYTGVKVELSDEERRLVEQIVRTEAGTGFIEQALVAQCIRDTIVYYEASSVMDVYTRYQYDCKWDRGTNEETRKAVEFIFDEGGAAINHRICYFYAPNIYVIAVFMKSKIS